MNEENQSAVDRELSEQSLRQLFEETDYVASDEIVTTVLLALHLGKPLLVEGDPGSGKTELAKVLAEGFGTDLIRLQCYEGLTAENTLYEWNYTKQLLAVQADEGGVSEGDTVFDEEYLLERPLLRALRGSDERPAILLIDEIDRADEEFEALLLEVLSDFQISVPELGTVEAGTPPIVVITSNRTRGLSDALRRRCLFLPIEQPDFEKEQAIIRRKIPELDGVVAASIVGATQRLREESLLKQPGVAETIDWARAIADLRTDKDEDGPLSRSEIENTLGVLLKEVQDIERVDQEVLAAIHEAASGDAVASER